MRIVNHSKSGGCKLTRNKVCAVNFNQLIQHNNYEQFVFFDHTVHRHLPTVSFRKNYSNKKLTKTFKK